MRARRLVAPRLGALLTAPSRRRLRGIPSATRGRTTPTSCRAAVTTFQAPRGTRDILAPESASFAALIATFADRAARAGFGLVISPMFEDVGVFRRGVGEESEVVTKEMYEFE